MEILGHLFATFSDLVVALLMSVFSAIRFLFSHWILQAIFAAWLAFSVQRTHHIMREVSAFRQKQHERMNELIKVKFDLLYKRIYALGSYQNAINENKEEWESEWGKYRDAVHEWGEKSNGLTLSLLVHFPAKMCWEFDHQIDPRLARLDHLLRNIRIKFQNKKRVFKSELDEVKRTKSKLLAITNKLKMKFHENEKERIKILEMKPRLSIKNIEHLSAFYLTKTLFQPSKQL